MRVPVKSVYLNISSPAAPAGVIAEGEWDPEQGAIYYGADFVVPFIFVRQMSIVPVAPASPTLEEIGKKMTDAIAAESKPGRRRFVK